MSKGLNTEAPLINFPDEFTTEEQNYELLVNGSRRRRQGLGLETGGVDITIGGGYTVNDPVRTFDWENVANIPAINRLVMQVGYILHIFDDTTPVSQSHSLVTIDMRDFAVLNATDAQIASWPVEASFGRGHLFIFGKYTNPFYIEFNPDTGIYTANVINIRERDFTGVDDGYDNTAQPLGPIASHTYNLKNRGWSDSQLADFQTDQSKQPSKAMIPWLGLVRTLTPSDMYDADGVRTFSPAKLVAELFQDASAPVGHFIKSPFSDSDAPDASTALPILTWTINEVPGPQTMIITTDGAHGLAVSDSVLVAPVLGTYNTTPGIPTQPQFTVDQYVTVTVVDSPTVFRCVVNFPSGYPFVSWHDQYQVLGNVYVTSTANPTGNVIDFRPKAGAFFAGRVWYAGVDTARLGGRLYFSQVIENDPQYAKCYQVADPTDERFPDLVATDGGVIVIPEASNVLKVVPYGMSLIVVANNGIWEIGPGSSGYFAATGYSVRKITDSGAVSSGAFTLADNIPVYLGITDIYSIQTNPQSGLLTSTNISQSVINTFYNDIPLVSRRSAIGVWDDLGKRLVWLYNSSGGLTFTYDRALVYDLRLGAFIPFAYGYTETDFVASIFALKEAGEQQKIKYVGILASGTTLRISEPNNSTDYVDLDISEPACYLITGYDFLGNVANQKVVPRVTVFSRKTETGYGPAPDYEPVRTSSTQMRSRWDWSDNASASRWGNFQEVYRRGRTYIPADPTTDHFDNGEVLVVSNNMIRGCGRVLQLEMRAGSGVDSWLQGWKTNFNAYGG